MDVVEEKSRSAGRTGQALRPVKGDLAASEGRRAHEGGLRWGPQVQGPSKACCLAVRHHLHRKAVTTQLDFKL